MSGTWMMRKGQVFIPLQFAGSLGGTQSTHASMGNWTEASFSPPGQVVVGLGGVDGATGGPGANLAVPKHRFVGNHKAVLPLTGTMLVQITSSFGIDGPFQTAMLAAGGGPGTVTWCPSNPACATTGLPPGPIGNNGRVIYNSPGAQFGGTMQMGLSRGGIVAVKGGLIPAGLIGHVKFGGSGTTLRQLAVGGPQKGVNTPATEFVKLKAGVLTLPGSFPSSGMLIYLPGPVVGTFPSITTPMGAMTGQFTSNWGFGVTTGTVIVQQVTGTGGDDFLSAMGLDSRSVGGGGNINLVAGGLARRNAAGGFQTIYAQFDKVFMTLGPPVPSMSPAGVAAAGALIVLAVGYALRRRLP
jgi:hypothetical protein